MCIRFVFMVHVDTLPVAPSACGVKRWALGAGRLPKKNLKEQAADWLYPAHHHQRIIHNKRARKGVAQNAFTPENINLILHVVINTEISKQGGGWSVTEQPVAEPVSEPPTETVTVQPDGTIQHGKQLKKKYICYRV